MLFLQNVPKIWPKTVFFDLENENFPDLRFGSARLYLHDLSYLRGSRCYFDDLASRPDKLIRVNGVTRTGEKGSRYRVYYSGGFY